LDWADSPELIEIYLAEVDDRTARLVSAASELSSGGLGSFDIEDVIRDAHTLKGSSHMLGRTEIGAAAAALERGWRVVDEVGFERSQGIAEGLALVASLVADSAHDGSEGTSLQAAAGRLTAAVDALAEPVPSPALAGHQGGEAADGLPPSPEAGQVGAPIVEPVPMGAVQHPPTPERGAGADSVAPHLADPTSLGGLLGILTDDLSGAVTRVDTRDLYRLINRAVEIGLDAESLADLTHVSFEGVDPTKLLAAWRAQLTQLSDELAELQSWAVGLADVPLRDAVETFPQFVRFLGRRLGREVKFVTSGDNVEVDRQIVDALREPLRHLIVNAIDHGIEPPEERVAGGKPKTGLVRFLAAKKDDRLVITVADDGRGVDWSAVTRAAAARGLGRQRSELMAHLFRPGFSTVGEPNDFSGTGEGLTLVADAVDRIGGSVLIGSREGQGTAVRIDVPISLVLQNIVIVAGGDQFFGVSEPTVKGTISLETASVRFGEVGRVLVHEGEDIPIVSFARAVGLGDSGPENEGLVLNTRYGLVVVAVEEIVDRRRVAVKSLGPILDGADHITGAAFVGGGEVLVVVDHNYLGAQARRPEALHGVRPMILVVDDSAGVRQLISATLRGKGFDVTVAPGAREAVREIAHTHFDALIVDYAMPKSDGVELVKGLRRNGIVQPIIMVSGVADESDKAAAWEAGVDAYLDKYDLRRGSLTTTIRRLLEAGNGREPR
jgi:chemotaxis protein histidine kinase CheA